MRKAPCITARQSRMQEAPTNPQRGPVALLYRPPARQSRPYSAADADAHKPRSNGTCGRSLFPLCFPFNLPGPIGWHPKRTGEKSRATTDSGHERKPTDSGGYALRNTEIRDKDFYFLATAAAGAGMMERTMDGMEGFTDCLPGAKVKAKIYGSGMYQKGEVKDTSAYRMAYVAGKEA